MSRRAYDSCRLQACIDGMLKEQSIFHLNKWRETRAEQHRTFTGQQTRCRAQAGEWPGQQVRLRRQGARRHKSSHGSKLPTRAASQDPGFRRFPKEDTTEPLCAPGALQREELMATPRCWSVCLFGIQGAYRRAMGSPGMEFDEIWPSRHGAETDLERPSAEAEGPQLFAVGRLL